MNQVYIIRANNPYLYKKISSFMFATRNVESMMILDTVYSMWFILLSLGFLMPSLAIMLGETAFECH